jgi:Icc-related predicted phosphoesterase
MPLTGERVVITHHAPVINPKTQYADSPISPAFNSLDMLKVIEDYQPNLWVYGHTHECDDQTIGKTRILSNQLGYPNGLGGHECLDFKPDGYPIDIEK